MQWRAAAMSPPTFVLLLAAALLFACGPDASLSTRETEGFDTAGGQLVRNKGDAGYGTDEIRNAPLGSTVSSQVELGFPSPAGLGLEANWLVVKPQFVLAYDTTRKVPLWVSWTLERRWLGEVNRAENFLVDPTTPRDRQAKDSDYRYSGWSRGHLCPGSDRNATTEDNRATFTWTNIAPQTSTFNEGTWLDLEMEMRRHAERNDEKLYLIAGPLFEGPTQAIGSGVHVPSHYFKVVVFAKTLDSINTSTTAFAVIVPNDRTPRRPWRDYLVTINEVQRRTGLDFLSDVNDEIEGVLEERLTPPPPRPN